MTKEEEKEYKKQWRIRNKEILKKKKQEYYIDNKVHINQKSKQYYVVNKEEILKQNKQYKTDNKERRKIIDKKYRDNNKEILKQKGKKRYVDNKEEIKKYNRNYYNNHPEKYNKVKSQQNSFKRHYKITLEEYNLMFENQNGKCAICGRHQDELKRALAVDHNHITGNVRGLLCDSCNSGIGYLKDNVQLLQKAIDYLKK